MVVFDVLAAVLAPGPLTDVGRAPPVAGQQAFPGADRIGIERVVVACRAGAGIDDDLRRRLCGALLRGARARIALPAVIDDTGADAVPDGRGRHDVRLVATATRVAGTVHVTLQLARHAFVQGADTLPGERVTLAATADSSALDAALAEPLNRLFPRGDRRGGDVLGQY